MREMACNKNHKYYDPLYEKPEEFEMWICTFSESHFAPIPTFDGEIAWPSGSKAWFLLILIQYHVLL